MQEEKGGACVRARMGISPQKDKENLLRHLQYPVTSHLKKDGKRIIRFTAEAQACSPNMREILVPQALVKNRTKHGETLKVYSLTFIVFVYSPFQLRRIHHGINSSPDMLMKHTCLGMTPCLLGGNSHAASWASISCS